MGGVGVLKQTVREYLTEGYQLDCREGTTRGRWAVRLTQTVPPVPYAMSHYDWYVRYISVRPNRIPVAVTLPAHSPELVPGNDQLNQVFREWLCEWKAHQHVEEVQGQQYLSEAWHLRCQAHSLRCAAEAAFLAGDHACACLNLY